MKKPPLKLQSVAVTTAATVAATAAVTQAATSLGKTPSIIVLHLGRNRRSCK